MDLNFHGLLFCANNINSETSVLQLLLRLNDIYKPKSAVKHVQSGSSKCSRLAHLNEFIGIATLASVEV